MLNDPEIENVNWEWARANWFRSAALGKALDLLRWPTGLKSWGRGPARDVWVEPGPAWLGPRLVTSDDVRAVIVNGGFPEEMLDELSIGAADVPRMVEWLSGWDEVYRVLMANVMRTRDGTDLPWSAAGPCRATQAFDAWLRSLVTIEHRAWHLWLRCEEMAAARKALAASACASAPGILDVLVTPWSRVLLSLDGGPPISTGLAQQGVFPDGLSLHVRLPAHAFFGLFSGIYKGRGLAALDCWNAPARPHEAVLSVARDVRIADRPGHTTIGVTNVALATAANGADVGVSLPWPDLSPSIIEQVCDALEDDEPD
jgi:hypothetical protein